MRGITTLLVAGELALAAVFFGLAPQGTHWLGATIAFPSDVAVYLSYIIQGQEGHVLLHNLYAVEAHHVLFHPVWSVLALIAHLPLSLSPVILHEGARVIFTILLCSSLWFIGRRMTTSVREAKLFFFLSWAGIGTGWLFSIWLGLTHGWRPHLDAAPDVFSEFSAFPTLLGGAHVILSLALLIPGLFWTWTTLTLPPPPLASRFPSPHWLGGACLGLLLAIHPYFAPLIGFFITLALIEGRKLSRHTRIKNILILGACFTPAILIYLPLYRDVVFRTHHLTVNQLPLASFGAWIATLLPFIGALIWRMRRGVPLQTSERWVIAWILSALLAIVLPFPWKRKYTEGLGIACILLTLPAWQAVRDWLMRHASGFRRSLIVILICIGASLSPLHLIISAIVWATNPATTHYFYQPHEVFAAWKNLREHTTSQDVILTDNTWLNLWTPSYTGRTVATGHDHETPNYISKQTFWRELGTTEDTKRLQYILDELKVTHLLLTTETSKKRFESVLAIDGWKLEQPADSTWILIRQ